MHLKNFPQLSLKTRVTFLTLVIFMISIWTLTAYITRVLREDIRRLLVDQQFSMASFIAKGVNQDMEDRLHALATVAASIHPSLLDDAGALQAFLNQRETLQGLFNHGTLVAGIDGTTIASFPISAGRLGVNYGDRDFMIAALKDGKAMIGRPVMGKLLKSPIFAMAVPIRDTRGKVIGALSGTINLSLPSFLDNITEYRYGKTGGYLLVDGRNRLVVTATEKKIIMGEFPAPGVSPVIDRFIQGYEGSEVFVAPRGEEVLASVKGIPVAGWYVSVQLPSAEAFAPIRAMQQHMLLAALFLTLLTGGLTWWVLKRQLAPLLTTATTLANMSNSDQPLRPLEITRQDEIGQLIGSFNRLLETLAERENLLRSESVKRIQAQQGAEKADKLLRESINSMAQGFAVYDADDCLVLCNEAYLRFYETSRDLIVPGNTFEEIIRQGAERGQYSVAIGGVDTWVKQRMAKHQMANGEVIEQQIDDGRWIMIAEHRTPSGYVVGSRIDITHIKEVEQDLIVARDEAESASRAKSEFLSSMSHELRTPMNAILGFGQLMAYDDSLAEEHKDGVGEILKAGHHLLTLIDEVLDLAKIESGYFDLSLEPVELPSIVDECLILVSALADKRGIRISLNGVVGKGVRADRVRLKQVLLNVLSNAIKYNREGGSVMLAVEDKNTERLLIRVTDTGPGISAERLKELFQPFNRLGAESGPIEGTGIGLTITRRIVEMMEGSVGVESEVGIGSTFWIELPRETMAARGEEQPAVGTGGASEQRGGGAAPHTVLYIEDSPTNLKLVEKILGRRKHIQLLTAHTPELGIELAQVRQPDLILLDINMPGLDGYQVLKIFKADANLKTIPVVAVTANAMPHDIERGMAAGFTDYLTKPLDMARFNDVMDHLFGVDSTPKEGAA